MRYRTLKNIVVECIYNGSLETITVPVDRVFDGDTLKSWLYMASEGIAWVVHDWMYYTHAFDTKPDGTTTKIENRWSVDELMYILLTIEGSPRYAYFLQTFDSLVRWVLDHYWGDRVVAMFVPT